MAGVHSRARSFDAAAAAYERGRPGWPVEALEIVARRLGLGRDAAVLDLAAGTGKLTRLLATRFATVTAVEPLDGMRKVLEAEVPAARALAGTAEAIPLPAASVDAVFVAEAIHWFDPERATAEIARVLRPGGGAAVLYNRHEWREDAQNPWIAAVEEVLQRHRLPADDVDPHDETRWRAALGAIGPLHDDVVEQNAHRLDREGLVAMYASFSSIAGLPPDRREVAIVAVRAVLREHGVDEAELVYRTEITTVRG
jgi:ubiquinone/menaquinone biosynthesis C-methylase UbiE